MNKGSFLALRLASCAVVLCTSFLHTLSFAQSICPTGTTKTIVPSSPLCIVRANVRAPQDTDFILTGYDHLFGECILAAGVPQPPQVPSSQIMVTAGQQRTSWLQGSPWANQLDPLLTCPAGAVKKSCSFTSGAGPLGEIVCACYAAGVTPPAIVQEPTYTCVADLACAEGQYWCNAENTCKPAGQSCSAATCNNTTPVSWTQFSNPSPSNINSPSAISLGNAAGTIQIDGKTIQVSYAGDVRSVGIASNWAWVWTNNTAPFLSTLVTNIPDPAHLLGVFGGSQTMNTLTFSESVTDPILLFYSIGGGGVNATYEFDRPFTIVSGSTGMTGMGDFVNPSGNILRGAEGYGVIQFHGTFSTLAFKVPTAEYWSAFTVGLKGASSCPASVICNKNNICETGESCNCGDCTNGGADDKDRCGFSNGSQMVCTKDIQNTTTAGGFNSVTAQANFDIVNGKLATYLSSIGNLNVAAGEFGTAATELKITQNDWKDTSGNFIVFTSFTKEEAWTRAKELLAIPASAQVLWSKTSIKYENDGLGDNERYLYSYVIQQTAGVQKQIFFATEFLPGYGWRKVYAISKDYPLSTTPTGAEVCQNFTNPRLFLKPVASYQSPAQFCLEQGFRGTSTIINDTYMTGTMTMWNAAGTAWVPNPNGDKIDEIRCCGIPSNATAGAIQVGACCPVGTEWSSTANACVTDKCDEGQYYCHEELKCKAANEPCSAVVCEDKVVFNYTGAIQNYTVPADVSKVKIKAWGAAGGSGSSPWIFVGAAGGYAQGDISVTGGEQFKIVVGEGGKRASTLRTFGGGGHGTASWGGSGGGLSGIFRTSFTHANSLLIAGGGSGASGGGNIAEGFGGGLQGNRSMLDYFSSGYANGGTQTAGGVSVAPYSTLLAGSSGGPLSGGDANNWTCKDGGAGGGGGGYYGGAGGVGDWCTFPASGDTDGGGGSGYLHASLTNALFATSVAPNAPAITTYFGGMYGGPNYNNPLTGAQSCPTGYTATQISGTANVDYFLYLCTRSVTNTTAPIPTQYAEFGGMWGTGGVLSVGVLAERGINAYTGSASCPTGFTQYTVLGTAGLDYYMYYCMKSTGATVPTRDFGGMWGADTTIPKYYNNPVTGTASCPGGYAIRTGWGTDNVDMLFQWCYQTSVPSSTSASIAPKKTDTDYVTGVAEGKNTGDGSGGNGLVVITECRPKPTATCNNNGLCDTNESCNCADCNDKADHCSINTRGEQLICTKDTTPPCFTDKFPYCFPACLDGYTRNASGQCVASVIPDITYTHRIVDNNSNSAIATCQSGEVLVGGGCENYSGGAFFIGGFPIEANESWTRPSPAYDPGFFHSTYDYPDSFPTPLVASGVGYACSSGYAGTNVRARAICASGGANTIIRKGTIASNVAIAQCQTGEVRVGGGCRYVSGGPYFHASRPINKNETEYGITATEDGFICAGSASTQIEARAVCRPTISGQTVSVRPALAADYYAYCNAGEKVIGGGCRALSGAYFYKGFPIKAGTADSPSITETRDSFYCGSGASGAYNKPYAICAPVATTTVGSSCQNFTYPTLDNINVATNSYVANTDASANQFCTSKGYTSGTLLSGGNLGSITNIALEVKCCGGNVVATCQNYPNPAIGGGAVIVRPSSLGQFCREKGKPEPFMKTWNMVGTVAIWNGTSWYGNDVGGGATSLDCCTLTSGTTTTVSAGPQIGACCPPGSAWNSVENRCVPSTCGVGQFYCAAQKKCLPGGTTCDTTVCNNNGLCEGEESCQCGDCVDGPTQTDPTKKADDKDKCSIIGGIQAMCSDDIPTDNKPGACCLPPQTWNTATSTCMECSNTQAPSELKAGVDQPYISCTGNGDTTQTHFKYRLTKTSGTPTAAVFTSTTPVSVGTQVLHTATPFTEGTYKVECFYGTSTNVPTDSLSTPHTCTKNIQVKTGNVQGCDAIITHKDSLLTSVLHDANPFSASARCVSRTLDTTLTQPFRLFYGNAAPISLEYDSVFAMLEIVGLSVPNFHSYTAGNTDVRCAVKVGGGYSTNNSCLKTACVGGTCSLPQTFSVVNSANHTCTTEDKSIYDIGCNPLADQTTKDTCAKWFSDAFATHALSTNTFTTHFTFGGADTPIVCTKYPPGGLPGGLNMYANFVCKALLPNGEEVEIYGAEDNGTPIKALQTTAYTTKKDNEVPNLQPVTYYSSESLSASSLISTPTRWQKTNVTAVVTCTDAPGVSDGDTCACSPAVDTSSTTPDLWSPGIPDATVGADIMRYTRTITTSLNGATVAVRDTAGNISPDARTISIGVDTVAPTVSITTTGTAPSLAVTITATDNAGGSGIWKDNIQTQTYLATAPVPTFDDKCNLTSADTLLYETYSPTGTPLALTKSTTTPITLNTSTHKLAYCIQDNAGNITKGFYPSVPVACFSSTNLPTVPGTTPSAIPSIATYVAPLIARIAPATGVGQFGYGMSTDATNANCFRGIITSNVTRLISNQYNASTASTVDWSAPAKVKSNPTISNTNGYYYHTAMSPNLLTITSSPSGTGPKVVYAEGADIQINADINYRDSSTTTNSNTLLIIIAKRATSGANPAGGNIYINPNVKNIDAILITDGAIMNGVNGTPKDYITNPTDLINRLTINGRIYSMNTRGGSIDSSILASNNLGMITTNSGKVFANNASLTTNASPATAAAQDLERFRVINDDGNKQCTLFLNYKTIPINTLPPILQRPSGYAGGSCGF